jgi:cellulose synthase/poly-beta-1,6-N-acetylglucosamine synthase-like glycosyltransferase
MLTLSLVIPVYNEAHHIEACLQAVTVQTVMPMEVIVVDNNCSDETIALARAFPFVRIIRESRQGRGYARSAGFNVARGDIIGRIDADSIMAPDWVERVLHDFSDPSVMGVTGLGRTYTMPWRGRMPNTYTTLWNRVYYWSTHADFNCMTAWGANMALRRSMWERVRDAACLDDSLVHEDIDVSVLVCGAGGKIIQDNKLFIRTRGQSYHYWPKLLEYTVRRINTRRWHSRRGTLKQPGALKINWWQAQRWRLYSFIPGILFLAASFLWWPWDAARVRRGETYWLD